MTVLREGVWDGAEISIEELRREACEIAGQSLSLTICQVGAGDSYAVHLGNGHRLVRLVCSAARVHPVVRRLAEALRDRPYVDPVAPPQDGLASDYWWREVPLATAKAARDWVRWRLLADPSQSDLAMDRFIASLDPPKREELLRRAVNGLGPEGF
ncbi:hypothetical protein [Caldovatus aquaticus]|uniref:Uncharacterized protein n=1 Tax=Caldovatus aquaticus TaxID=2865671 RepID=A0ABS7F012_9PROT|nr:hypothetical protein [Caldovatus aquaticus]MBW8268297.1 hypothetical protein [Caldovatus aquaticus]